MGHVPATSADSSLEAVPWQRATGSECTTEGRARSEKPRAAAGGVRGGRLTGLRRVRNGPAGADGLPGADFQGAEDAGPRRRTASRIAVAARLRVLRYRPGQRTVSRVRCGLRP